MRTKALLNDDGRLYAKVKVYLVLKNGRRINATRVGNSYAPNVRANFSSMINTAVLDATYQVLAERNIDVAKTKSGDLGEEVSIEYDLKDYWIDYLSDRGKRDDYTYRTGFRGKGKKKEYVVIAYKKITSPDGTVKNVAVRQEPYQSKAIADIRREEFLYNEDTYSRGKRRVKFNNKTYRTPYMKKLSTGGESLDVDTYVTAKEYKKMYAKEKRNFINDTE